MICPALASVLRSGRSDFNARFAEARIRFPGLSGESFSLALQELVDPAVAAVAALHPEGVGETVSAAYDVALELAGQNMVTGTHGEVIAEGWRTLLPAAARHLAEAPRSVLPAVSNALHHLAATPGARPAQWIRDLARLAEQCRTSDEFLKLGQAAAWRCGLAHYRPAALALLDSVPEPLSLALLGATPAASWSEVRARLERDPWYDPSGPEPLGDTRNGRLREVGRIGAFRGFGGLFIEPPLVSTSEKSILVRSGEECWLLTADCFGATFHRSSPALWSASARQEIKGLEIAGTTLRRDGHSLNLDHLGSISSVAATADTLAITSPLTHAVVLVAMT
jgi:hypothetical protein